ncbi:MAG: hypothetical protein WEA10_06110, partial [Actinomycetota bacterium]
VYVAPKRGGGLAGGGGGPPPAAPSASVGAAQAAAAGSTPDLLDAAASRGEITPAQANRYLVYALSTPDRVPERFLSDVPWDGTPALLALLEQNETGALPPDLAAKLGFSSELARATVPGNQSRCGGYGPFPNKVTTKFFTIHYAKRDLANPLNISDYKSSLNRSFRTEVKRFGWWKPPQKNNAGSKYHAYVAGLGGGLYGFATTGGTYAGLVNNNPHSPWPDHDAYATCLVLNDNYRGFPTSARGALDATSAHEYNHALQFGIGGLTGAKRPTIVWYEGGTTYMEDEVWDTSNDSWFYLWPEFDVQMARYNKFPYSYWVVYRAMLEQYGTGVANGGQLVMRTFFELTSKEIAGNLGAWNQALTDAQGGVLNQDYHRASIALKFLKKCQGGYVYPYCLEEANGYKNTVGPTLFHHAIDTIGNSTAGSLPDNYSLNWVALPASGDYDVTVDSTTAGAQLRTSVVCDTGTDLDVTSLGTLSGIDSDTTLVDADGCVTRPVVVISNVTWNGSENPSSPATRSYTVSTDLP